MGEWQRQAFMDSNQQGVFKVHNGARDPEVDHLSGEGPAQRHLLRRQGEADPLLCHDAPVQVHFQGRAPQHHQAGPGARQEPRPLRVRLQGLVHTDGPPLGREVYQPLCVRVRVRGADFRQEDAGQRADRAVLAEQGAAGLDHVAVQEAVRGQVEGDEQAGGAQIRALSAGGLLLGPGDVVVPGRQEHPATQPHQLHAVPLRREQQGVGELAGAGALLRPQFLMVCDREYKYMKDQALTKRSFSSEYLLRSLDRRQRNRKNPTMPRIHTAQMIPVMRLNISSSIHCDLGESTSTASPQSVAMQWYTIPARKMPRVLRVRHTSPQGQILLRQQSITPSMYRIDSTKVPPHTSVDPYRMKYRKDSKWGSWHWVYQLATLVTQATINTHRLFSWVGMLKGSRYFDSCICLYKGLQSIQGLKDYGGLARLLAAFQEPLQLCDDASQFPKYATPLLQNTDLLISRLLIVLLGGGFFLIGKLLQPLGRTADGAEAAALAPEPCLLAAGATFGVECLHLVVLAAPEAEAAQLIPHPQAADIAPAAPATVADQALTHIQKIKTSKLLIVVISALFVSAVPDGAVLEGVPDAAAPEAGPSLSIEALLVLGALPGDVPLGATVEAQGQLVLLLRALSVRVLL